MSFEASVGNRLSSSKYDVPETDLDFHSRPENYTGSNIHALNKFVLTQKRRERGAEQSRDEAATDPMSALFDRYKDVIIEEEILDLKTQQSVTVDDVKQASQNQRKVGSFLTQNKTGNADRAFTSTCASGNRSYLTSHGRSDRTKATDMTHLRSTTAPAFDRLHLHDDVGYDRDTPSPHRHTPRAVSFDSRLMEGDSDRIHELQHNASFNYQLVSTCGDGHSLVLLSLCSQPCCKWAKWRVSCQHVHSHNICRVRV